MSTKAITITTSSAGQYHVAVQNKPRTEEIKSILESLLKDEVQTILVSMPGVLATEFMLVQSLALLRRSGKELSIEWTDHAPSPSTQHIILSLIQ